MTDGDKTIGEIGRAVERLEIALASHQQESRARFHELANTMTTALSPMSVHALQIENQQHSIGRLDDELGVLRDDLKKIEARAASIAGGIGVVAFLAQFVPWPWKGH